MAQSSSSANKDKLTLFSLAGYLQLQKRQLLKNSRHRFWFWFDEKTCCLKYYRNQEKYLQGINDPQGMIDLRYAKVTPGITSGSTATNCFHIDANDQVYVIVASDSNEALAWISNLQEKRGEFIKLSAAMEETALEQERDRRTLKGLSKPVGLLANEASTAQKSPPRVRKIVSSKINRGSMALELIPSLSDPARRCTIDPLMHHTDSDDPNSPNVPLTPEDRKLLKLEASCHDYQVVVDKLQKEVLYLREQVENRDHAIQELNLELAQAKEDVAKMSKPHRELKMEMNSLEDILKQYKRSVKSLNDEVELQKLNQKEHDKRISQEKQRVLEMERELNTFKSKYIKLLSTKFKVEVHNPTHGQEEAVEDVELTRHTQELQALVELEGAVNLSNGAFEDEHGDIHDWQTDLITHHYLCRQLYLHYNQHETESHNHDWEEFISRIKRTRRPYLDLSSGERSKNELRSLLRKGVPIQFRMIVWSSLVFHSMGRVKETKDAISEGGSYYWSLVHSKAKSDQEKQIKIDLHRTLPNNRHFKLNGSGIPKLENILIAFSKHNRKIGYCQGMNMVAALGLLFLDEETVFWFMIYITEKLLPDFYYTPDLLGAQADQRLMKDLLGEMLPRLSSHLDNCGIDMTFVTLNWFLTLFVDSMPTESALRIMDCFLLEGPKLIFRSSLSILRLNQNTILKIHDSFLLFQLVKELARHIFDMEALFQEFPKLSPFPNRASLSSRHQSHLAKLRIQWDKREKEIKKKREKQEKEPRNQPHELLATSSLLKESLSSQQASVQQRLVWECGCVCGRGEVWLCGGEGRFGVISPSDKSQLSIPNSKIIPRVLCVHYLPELDIVLMGTLDFNLAAFHCSTKQERWRHTLTDSVLAITGSNTKLFVALANGLVAMFQGVSDVDVSKPQMLRVGSTTINSLVQCGPGLRFLWCACGKSITIMCTESLEPVESLVTSERVNKLLGSEVGVWASFRSSSVITLYDTHHYLPLLSVDYATTLPPQQLSQEEIEKCNHRVTSLMMDGDKLWVGTGGGRVLVFTYAPNVADAQEAISSLAALRSQASDRETSTSPPPNAGDGGGLLSSVVVSAGDSTAPARTPEQEKWVEIEMKDHAPSAAPPGLDRYKKRRTQFGKTLRNKNYHKQRRRDLPDVYHLQFLHCSHVITAANDSVRVILPFSSGCGTDAVSCLNTVKTDWKKGVQLWTCSNETSSPQWEFQFLDPHKEPASAATPTTLASDNSV